MDKKTTTLDKKTTDIWNTFKWKRACDIFKGKLQIFQDSIDINDILQGALGN